MTMQDLAMKTFTRAHVALFRMTGGRVGSKFPGGARVLLLTVKGRKSGQPRTAPLLYLEDEGRIVIVASKAGAPDDPLWYKNLVANPEVEVETKGEPRRAMRARTASDEERAALWPKLVAMYPSYADYQKRTDRKIPVVLLT